MAINGHRSKYVGHGFSTYKFFVQKVSEIVNNVEIVWDKIARLFVHITLNPGKIYSVKKSIMFFDYFSCVMTHDMSHSRALTGQQ